MWSSISNFKCKRFITCQHISCSDQLCIHFPLVTHTWVRASARSTAHRVRLGAYGRSFRVCLWFTDGWFDSPDSKVNGAIIGLIWSRQGPGGPHVGPMNLDIWVVSAELLTGKQETRLIGWRESGITRWHQASEFPRQRSCSSRYHHWSLRWPWRW